MTYPTHSTLDTAPALSRNTAEREATVLVNMPVHEHLGRRLGTVAAIHHDPLTGRMTGITVRHGWLGSKHVRIPMAELVRVTQGTVVIMHSKAAFRRLPLSDPPPGSTRLAHLAWKR